MKLLLNSISCMIALAMILGIFTGCMKENSKDSASSQGQSSVAVLIGKNQLAGKLALDSKALNDDITNAAMNEGKVAAVEIDGNPFVIDQMSVEKDANNPSQGRTRQLANNAISALSAKIGACVPLNSEIDMVEAINQSVNILTGSDAVGDKVLYILACGFSTAGILNMTEFNLFESNIDLLAQDVSPYIADMSGISVKWLNMGDVNSNIQEKPDNKQLDMLKQFYSTLFRAKGGAVEFLSDTGTYSVEGEAYPKVTPVNIPKNSLSPQRIEVKLGEDKLSFKPDTADLTDPSTAKNTIAQIAKSIIESQQTVTLIGSTASWGSQERCLTLSEKRCLVVKQLLVNSGVAEDRLKVVAIGRSKASVLRVSDLNSGGELIESEGRKNRFVFITSTPEDYL